ncbi:MAG TPA: aldose 1-epimerase [Phnomibacter sp.]|nr:aldose 1-epimerase [Phnomibacter sp.]
MYYANILPDKIILSSGTSTAEIWPAQGAILNSWKVNLDGELLDVIDGYTDADDFSVNAESKGFRSCKLSPYVCRLNKGEYSYDGRQYHIGKFDLNGSSIHGLLYDVPFEVLKHEANDHLAMAIVAYQYTGTDKGYPYVYEAVVTYTLINNKITIGTQITNRHHGTIPLADGWHPYFKLGGTVNDWTLQMASKTMVEFNDALIPTGALQNDERFTNGQVLGATKLDNCFLLEKLMGDQPACTLKHEKAGAQLSIFANSHYPYLQVYTPPHRQSIAIENLSAAPDAFNNKMGLILLEAGESIGFSCTYAIGKCE